MGVKPGDHVAIWRDIESASARMISDDECELKVPVTRTDSTKSEVTLTAVKVDGSWRLNDIYEG